MHKPAAILIAHPELLTVNQAANRVGYPACRPQKLPSRLACRSLLNRAA